MPGILYLDNGAMNLPLVVMLLMLVTASFTDIRNGKIYNWCTLVPAMLALGWHMYSGEGLLFSAAGWFSGLGLLIIPFALGGIGAGDVKLLAGVGALMGAGFALRTFLLAAVIGGIMALGKIIYDKGLGGLYGAAATVSSGAIFAQHFRERDRKDNLPYGVAIAAGAITALFWRF